MLFYIRNVFVLSFLVSLGAIALALEVEGLQSAQIFDRNHVNLNSATNTLFNSLEYPNFPRGSNVELSIDARVNKVLEEEVDAGRKKYGAKSGLGLILDVRTGEVIALTESGPEKYALHDRNCDVNEFNKISEGVFEFGAAYKLMTLALALDEGRVSYNGKVDARSPLRYGRFEIHDYKPQARFLSVPEVILYSSNIASARLARQIGDERYKKFLGKIGIMTELQVPYLKSVTPIYPREWSTLNTMTVAFGHGIAISPLRAAVSVAALVNGGYLVKPTILKVNSDENIMLEKTVVIKSQTSDKIRNIMRMNVESGTAKTANIPSVNVGGVTTTTEKVIDGHYSPDRLQTSFFGIFPSENPQYLVLTMLDEPQGRPTTNDHASAAWNASPIAAQVIEKVSTILGRGQN